MTATKRFSPSETLSHTRSRFLVWLDRSCLQTQFHTPASQCTEVFLRALVDCPVSSSSGEAAVSCAGPPIASTPKVVGGNISDGQAVSLVELGHTFRLTSTAALMSSLVTTLSANLLSFLVSFGLTSWQLSTALVLACALLVFLDLVVRAMPLAFALNGVSLRAALLVSRLLFFVSLCFLLTTAMRRLQMRRDRFRVRLGFPSLSPLSSCSSELRDAQRQAVADDFELAPGDQQSVYSDWNITCGRATGFHDRILAQTD